MINEKDEWGNISLPGFGDDKLLDPNLNRKFAAQEVVKRPSWKKNNHEAITKPDVTKRKGEKVKQSWQENQTERRANIATAITNLWEDPNYGNKVVATKKARGYYDDPTKTANYKGPVIGTCKKTGKKITLIGPQQIKDAGFEPGNVYACISGTRKSTGGYTWSRK